MCPTTLDAAPAGIEVYFSYEHKAFNFQTFIQSRLLSKSLAVLLYFAKLVHLSSLEAE